nr:hypothetical protein [uncultured Cohaesibacter sp.]
MEETIYVDVNGVYIGAFIGFHQPEAGWIEVPFPPEDAHQIWSGDHWGQIPLPALQPLTPRQLRLTLSRHGYLSQVKPALEAIEDVQAREEALIEWGFATQYDPENPLIDQLRVTLGISKGQMDAMWRTGETL